MTVSSYSPHSYHPGSAMLAESLGFAILAAGDVVVTHEDADTGVRTVLALDTDYEISGPANAEGLIAAPSVRALAEYPADDWFHCTRATTATQPEVMTPQQPLPAKAVERGLDRATMLAQEQAETVGRSLKFPPGDAPDDLPSQTEMAGKYLAFDVYGNPVPSDGTGADDGLRADLAGTGGGALVGLESGDSVQDAIDDLDAAVTGGIALRSSVELSPIFLDMYWELHHGVGWSPNDPGDGATQFGSTFTASAAANAASVTVADGTSFFAGQLIDHVGSDGDYYTNVVYSKMGTSPATLNLAVPLKAAVSSGGLIGVDHNDYNHPREYGRRSIADFVVRKLTASGLRKRRLVAAQRDWDTLYPVNASVYDDAAATVAAYNTLNYGNPGSDFARMWGALVTPADVNYGVASFPVALDRMTGEVEVLVNPLAVAGGMHTLQCFVTEEGPGPSNDLAAPGASVLVTGRDCVQKVTIPFSKGDNTRLRVWVRSTTGDPFRVGARRFYETGDLVQDLTSGSWVTMSDSWNANAGLPEITTRLTAKLPNTVQHNSSVSGNKSADHLARFAADIPGFAPRVFLSLVGTNDWAQGVARTVYGGNIQELVRKAIAIGAQPVILGPSVGSTEDMDGMSIAQLQTSRAYVCSMEHEWSRVHDDHVTLETQWNRGPITIAAGARIGLLVCLEATAGGFWLEHLNWSAEVPAVQMRIGFASTIGPNAPAGTLDDEIAFSSPAAAGTAEKTRVWIPKSDLTTARFAWVIAVNTDGSDRTLNFFQARAAVWPVRP